MNTKKKNEDKERKILQEAIDYNNKHVLGIVKYEKGTIFVGKMQINAENGKKIK